MTSGPSYSYPRQESHERNYTFRLGYREVISLQTLIAALAVLGAFGMPAFGTTPPDFSQVVVAVGPPGFVVAPAGTANTGRLDAQQFAQMAVQPPPKGAEAAHFEGYLRRWDNRGAGQTIFVLGTRFASAEAATSFDTGIRSTARDKNAGIVSTFAVSGVPPSFGYTQRTAQLSAVAVAFTKGRYAFLVEAAGRSGRPPPNLQLTQTLAQQQYAATPVDAGAQTHNVAYLLGEAAAPAILVIGIVWLVLRSRRRKSASPPPGIGTSPEQDAPAA